MRLEVEGVAFSYGDRRVLDNVSVVVESGDVLGIIGPNGSGKSTLVRCMFGALHPACGSVRLDGIDVTRASRAWIARRVGVCPQSCAPGFPFEVQEFVSMGRFPHERGIFSEDTPNGAQVVETALERTGIIHLRRRTIDQLSGGEFRKVLLAQVFAQEPRLLLLDEPLQQLDLRHQLEVMDLVADFARSGEGAAVAVLHDLNMAARYCGRLLLLSAGCIAAAGSPEEVLTPERLRVVYGLETAVRRCEDTGALRTVPLAPAPIPVSGG
ncbi:MAG: ABC transporter ATP-binding protein [Planctomycetota bacterium]